MGWGENLPQPFTRNLIIFCQSSLLSNFKAVLIVAGLKIRFHCGASFVPMVLLSLWLSYLGLLWRVNARVPSGGGSMVGYKR